MSGLVILQPIVVTDVMLTATDVPENDYLAWNAATAYVVGDRVIRAGIHKVFERVVAGTTATAPELDEVNWIEVSPTNRWKLMNSRKSTRTAKANSFYYEWTLGEAISGVHAGNIVGATAIRWRLMDPVYGVVYDSDEIDLTGDPWTSDWWSFFFGAWTNGVTQMTLLDLPAFPNAVLRMDVEGTADLAVGYVLFGSTFEFGAGLRLGPTTGIQDYSRQVADQWGELDLDVQAFAKRSRWTLLLNTSEVDDLNEFLASLRATPALYVGYEDMRSLVVYGICRNFDTLIPGPKQSECFMDLLGLSTQ